MATIEDQELEARRRAVIAEQRRILFKHEQDAQKSRERLEKLEQDDFLARLGSKPISTMSVKEKCEIVERIGYPRPPRWWPRSTANDDARGIAGRAGDAGAAARVDRPDLRRLCRARGVAGPVAQGSGESQGEDEGDRAAGETRICAHVPCGREYILQDGRGGSRRIYCSETCRSRANASLRREREKAASSQENTEPDAARESYAATVPPPNGTCEAQGDPFGQ
jgi:hypothetical protein